MLGLTVSDVVGALGKAVASVVAVFAELVSLLEPENNDFQVSELSFLLLGQVALVDVHQLHDFLLDFVVLLAGQLEDHFEQLSCGLLAIEAVGNLGVSLGAAQVGAAGSGKGQKRQVEKFHFVLVV